MFCNKMGDKMKIVLTEIPVWPKQVKLNRLCQKHGVGLCAFPIDAPIGEDGGWVCYPDQEMKDRYLKVIEGGKREIRPSYMGMSGRGGTEK